MKTERIIKKQSLDSLKGNWVALIAALTVLCTVFIVIEYSAAAVLYATGLVDPVTGNGENPILEVISAAFSVVFIFLFPMANGAVKMFCGTSKEKSANPSDLFYYFRGAGRYFKTVAVDFALFFIFRLLGILTDLYFWGEMIFNVSIWDGLFKSPLSPLMGLLLIVTVIIRIILFLLFVHFPLVAYALDDSKPAGQYIFGYIGIAFRNFTRSFRLFLSFSGWLASCFFVVPAIFVFPYIGVSAVSSARWLLEIEADRRKIC